VPPTKARRFPAPIAEARGAAPGCADVARRLGLGLDPASSGVTFGAAWEAWLAGKKRLRESSRERLQGIAVNWLMPVLADVPLERLNGAHCAAVFERVERISAEITARQGTSREYVHVDGAVRERPRPVTPEARRWSAAEARVFLAATAGDPLALDAGHLRVERPLLLTGTELVEGVPSIKLAEAVAQLVEGAGS
jgi:hypothetical protein